MFFRVLRSAFSSRHANTLFIRANYYRKMFSRIGGSGDDHDSDCQATVPCNIQSRAVEVAGGMSNKNATDTEEEKVLSSMGLEGTKPLATQVGGHRFGKNGNKVGMLDQGNGIVLKALQAPPRGTRELWLYKTTFAPLCRDPQLLELRHFLPLYYGTQSVEDVTFLMLNNISHHFPKPNVLDLKMGRVTYDPDASEKKQQHEIGKYPPLKELGFQITGMMIHDPDTGCPVHYSKAYCRSVTVETMLTDGLGKFFGLQAGGLRRDVVECLLSRLRRIERWFQIQRIFNFYASSLLIVYSSQDDKDSGSPQIHFSAPSPTFKSCSPEDLAFPPFPSANPQALLCEDPAPGVSQISTVSDFALDSSCHKSEETHYNSGGKPSAGQKRGYVEQSKEEEAQEPSLSKQLRKESAKEILERLEILENTENTGQAQVVSETKDLPEEDQPSPSGFKECGTVLSGHEADAALSQCHSDAAEVGPNSVEMNQDQPGCAEPKQCSTGVLRWKAEADPCENKKDAGISDTEGVSRNRERSVAFSEKTANMIGRMDPSPVEVRMIDFAHVFPAVGKDSNYLFGLQKLIIFLEELLKM